MVDQQSRIDQWCAGFFDGDGNISAEVQPTDHGEVGYHISPKCVINGSYHGGFVDAEGSISAKVRQNDNCTTGYSVGPSVQVKHSVTDNPLVERLTEFPDKIGVDYRVREAKMENENHADQFIFTVAGKTNVKRYLEAIYPHLVLKKPQAELMIDEILPRMFAGKHTTKRGFLETMKYIEEMNNMKGGIRGKYDVEYFEDEWEVSLDG